MGSGMFRLPFTSNFYGHQILAGMWLYIPATVYPGEGELPLYKQLRGTCMCKADGYGFLATLVLSRV